VKRYTFVVHIHPNGPSTLENLSTQELVKVSDLNAVGPQIERWLDMLDGGAQPRSEGSAGDPEEPVSR
jgi:hypothetical protein